MTDDGPNDESLDQLIRFATQLGSAAPPTRRLGRRRAIVTVLAVALLACAVAGFAAWRSHRSSSTPQQTVSVVDSVVTTPGNASTTVGSSRPLVAAAPDPATTATATIAAPTSTGAVMASVTSAFPNTTPPPANGVIRWAEFSDGRVYLRGRVPSQTIADEIKAKAAAVVGEPNVVVEYDIVPGTPLPKSAPLCVRDSILFPAGGDQLNVSARSVLDLAVVLFKQNPQMSIGVSGYTDSTGSAAGNIKLSQRRVDAIVKYFTSRGVAKTQVSGVAMGEAQAVADNSTAEGRARNRRVELEVTNLLG